MRETFVVGNRVQVGGFFATLRFIGELSGQSGTWYGIEWDDKEKGKHRGDYNGVSYFSLANPETSASFVREKHLKRGIGVLDAISNRYMPIGKIDDSPDVINFFNMGGKEIQFYNRSKDGTQHVPRDQAWNLYQSDIDLSTYPVSHLESSPEELLDYFPRVTYINVSKTLIEDINIPIEILSGLPNVTSINISFNQFRVKTLYIPNNQPMSFPKIEKFHCDASNLTFKEFVTLTDLFPNLKVASFALNNESELVEPVNGSMSSVDTLALQQCRLSDWSEIQKLSKLPNLRMLNLLDNQLESVDLPVEAGDCGFSSLQMLILAGNRIKAWIDMTKLAYLPKLSNVVLYDNPICNLNVQRFRDEAIARLPRLQTFNKTEVSREERRSASILYVKMYFESWVKAGGPKTHEELMALKSFNVDSLDKSFVELHPTYYNLFRSIGDGIALSGSTGNEKIKSQLIKVTIMSRRHLKNGEKSQETKVADLKILSSMTVSKIKLLMSRQCKVPASHQMTLFYRPHQHPESEYALDSDLKTLSFYSVEDTDTIIVEL